MEGCENGVMLSYAVSVCLVILAFGQTITGLFPAETQAATSLRGRGFWFKFTLAVLILFLSVVNAANIYFSDRRLVRVDESLAGEGSYPCVIPGAVFENRAILQVYNMGKNPLTGVTVSIIRPDVPKRVPEYFFSGSVTMGTLAGNSSLNVPNGLLIDPAEVDPDGVARYVVDVSTQNGQFSENVWFHRAGKTDQWIPTWAEHQTMPIPPTILNLKCRSDKLLDQ